VPQVVGRCAWLVGLANNPGLNGKQGTILAVRPDGNGDQRIHLKLDQPNQPHQEVKAKPENISFTPPAAAAAPAAAPAAAAAVPAVSTSIPPLTWERSPHLRRKPYPSP